MRVVHAQIRYDIRGHGRSGMPTTPEGHASKLYADDFKAVAEAFGLRKPTLIGWYVLPPCLT